MGPIRIRSSGCAMCTRRPLVALMCPSLPSSHGCWGWHGGPPAPPG